MMTTGSDDQQSLTAVTALGEKVVSEASNVDEPANAEGQCIPCHDCTVSSVIFLYIYTSILMYSYSV